MYDRGITFGRRSAFLAKLFAMVVLLAVPSSTAADDTRVETVLSDLRGPAGVAIRQVPSADGYEIYIAEVGAGRIVRMKSGKPNASEEVITGFMASTDDDELFRLPGPHGLLFLDPNRLVVAGSEGEDRPFVRLYELPDQPKPISAEQHEQQAAPADVEEKSDDSVASFRRLARTLSNDKVPDYLVLSAVATNDAATIWRLPLRSGTLGDLSRFGKQIASPLAIAVEPRGYIIVVRPGGRNDSTTSRIEFVNPIDGRAAVGFAVELADIVGVAYSPRSGNLYAIAESTGDATRSGVYRIDMNETGDSNEPTATASLLAEVQRPTALAFGPDGALHVTSLGRDHRTGTLQRITGSL
jgi:hypothetical protein